MSQLRMNIRNAMVGMTVSEAIEFVSSLDGDGSRHYAKEFLRELKSESDYCPDSPDGPDKLHELDMGSLSIHLENDGTAYIDVICKYCGRSGCVGHMYDTQSVDWNN